MPRTDAVIARLAEAARQQAAEFIADRGARLHRGHPAIGVLTELAGVAARGSALEISPARMRERDRYLVSIALADSWDAAANDRDRRVPAAAGVLANAAADWDRAAGVSGAPSWRRHVAAGKPGGVLPKDLGA